ncbi:MAG: hypothetical protein KC503_37410, partial [Myxococcales bacterium]|nr:hypothetical protein [Myxococcales bacterium]
MGDAVAAALTRARVKVQRLRRLLAERGAQPQRVQRELRLARLLFDLALLEAPDTAARRRALLASSSRLRALLVRRDRELAKRGGEVRLLLARVESRLARYGRVRELAREVRRGWPALACDAALLEADAFSARSKHGAAARVLSSALSRCSGEQARLARYKLAWAEIRRRRLGPGSRQLEALLSSALPALFRQRVLRDLAAAWMAREAPRGAASLLVRHGGKTLGFELAEQVASRLLERQRAVASESLCRRALALSPPRAA